MGKLINRRVMKSQNFIEKLFRSSGMYLFNHSVSVQLLKAPHNRKLHMLRIQAEKFKMKPKTPYASLFP